MGTFQYKIGLKLNGANSFEEVEPWVDTGALYSQFPSSVLMRLGYTPNAVREFLLADGSVTTNPVGPVTVRIGDEVQSVLCTFAEEESEMLLGATTLELFSLVPDTNNHTLRPMRALRLTMLPTKDYPQ
jgi:predicted aspartyl protease